MLLGHEDDKLGKYYDIMYITSVLYMLRCNITYVTGLMLGLIASEHIYIEVPRTHCLCLLVCDHVLD